jgi:hypothetical protein
MVRAVSLVFVITLLVPFMIAQNTRFSAYSPVEAYEVRPGVLMMPRYTTEGELCEIGIERRHFSPDKIRLESALSRKEIDQILQELVPPAERGPKLPGAMDLGPEQGNTILANTEFENVVIQIASKRAPSPNGSTDIYVENIVASVRWKNRKCK